MATEGEKLDIFQKPTSNFSVRFTSIPETYAVGADVQCNFVVTEDLNITPRDWVGIYKVGWRTSKEYFNYQWFPVPLNYVSGKEVSCRVSFPGKVIVCVCKQ